MKILSKDRQVSCMPLRSIGHALMAPWWRSIKCYWLWYVIVLTALITFLSVPAAFPEKARLVLHGLCAQTPTHSFTFAGLLLPFDARMTGIYGGTLATTLYLVTRGRFLSLDLPSRKILACLVLFLLFMMADGLNSLFTDLQMWHPWTPQNRLRLLSGYVAGISLGAVLSWLLASSLYGMSRHQAGLQKPVELVFILVPLLPYAALLLSGEFWVYVPVAVLLMLSAWLTVSMVALAIIVLVLRLDATIDRIRRLHVPVAAASLLGLAIMLMLALGRTWLERTTGISSMY